MWAIGEDSTFVQCPLRTNCLNRNLQPPDEGFANAAIRPDALLVIAGASTKRIVRNVARTEQRERFP